MAMIVVDKPHTQTNFEFYIFDIRGNNHYDEYDNIINDEKEFAGINRNPTFDVYVICVVHHTICVNYY